MIGSICENPLTMPSVSERKAPMRAAICRARGHARPHAFGALSGNTAERHVSPQPGRVNHRQRCLDGRTLADIGPTAIVTVKTTRPFCYRRTKASRQAAHSRTTSRVPGCNLLWPAIATSRRVPASTTVPGYSPPCRPPALWPQNCANHLWLCPGEDKNAGRSRARQGRGSTYASVGLGQKIGGL